MTHMKTFAAAALATAIAGVIVAPTQAADHLDSPSVEADPQLDINDIYAFQSPTNPNNSVLIMTVNPGAGVIGSNRFSSTGTYNFNIDNTGNAVADVTYAAMFAPTLGGTQAVSVTRNGAAYATGMTGNTSFNSSTGAQLQADKFEDPFFFDLNGFSQNPSEIDFDNGDFFAGLDVTAIVLEVPSSELNGADSNIGVWGQTQTASGDQFDRMGRPGITTVLIPSGEKDNFNDSVPSNDVAQFSDEVNNQIAVFSNQANADALTPILLPDILTFDTSSAEGYLNGRRLEDDVIDASLALLTGGAITSDGVPSNDAAFPGVFPYLAAPNAPVPEPTGIALAAVAGLGLIRRRK